VLAPLEEPLLRWLTSCWSRARAAAAGASTFESDEPGDELVQFDPWQALPLDSLEVPQ